MERLSNDTIREFIDPNEFDSEDELMQQLQERLDCEMSQDGSSYTITLR